VLDSDVASRIVYTAITNGHAQLCTRPEVPDTDFVCFSDVELDRSDWVIRPIDAPADLSPRMRAKFHKMFPPIGYEWTVWIDGSHVINTVISPSTMVDDMIAASPNGFGLHRHPREDCVYADGHDVMTHPLLAAKRRGQPIAEQLAHYRRGGHPEHWGLWASGSMCRNESRLVRELMTKWWDEMLRWSERDQLSMPFVCRALGFRPDTWPWELYKNPHFISIDHNWEGAT